MSRKDVDYRYPDPNLRAKLEQALGKDQSEPITAEELAGLSGQLNASESNISDLTGLEHCTNLTYLYLGSNQISDISTLSNLNNPTCLELSSNQISDISALSNLNNLTLLGMKSNQISDVSSLASLTNLTWLYLSSNQISDISALSNLNNLTYLGLDGNQLTASAGPIIQALKDGGTTVTHDPIPDPVVVIIPDPNLRAKLEQALGKDQSEPITAEELAGLSGQLNASESNISDLTGLEHCTNLTELVLGSNQISDISALSNLNHLTGLYLGSNQISDISTLSNLNNLTGLDLGNNEVSDISALADLTNLTELYLGSNQISDISALTGLTNLTSQLVLSSNQISDITALSNLNHLTYLGLDGNQLTASAGPIIQALKDGGTTVTHDEIPAPAEVIIPAPNLRAKPWPFDDELAINDTSPTNPFRLGIYYPKWLRGKEKILNPYHDQFSKKILDLKRNSESRIDYFMQELNPRMGSNFAIVVVPSSDPEKQQGIRTLGIKLANAAPGRVDANGCLVRTRSLPEEYKRDINYQLQSINVTDTDLITGRKVLLLDDVSTSGISLEACKKLLLDAGAVEVQCAVLGKTADSWSLKGVIFDLDQTLVDSDIVKPFRDSRKWDLVEREIPKVRPYDRIKPLVNKLRNRNIKIGIVTSSPSVYCRQVLKQCSLRVDDIVGYHDTQRRKPHPDPLQLSLRKLGLDPRDVVAIGDKADDVCAAKAAGIISIAACWGVNESDRRSLTGSGANIICRTVEELEKKLQQWWYSWP